MPTRVNDRMIEAFRTVVNLGTATAAAEVLNTSQSSISRSILRLESVTQVRLFDRIKGRMYPTQEGKVLFEEVENSHIGLEKIQRTAEALRLNQRGHVGVICAPLISYGFISDVVSHFSKQHPTISVSVESRRSNVIAEMMSAQRFDLAIADYPYDPPGVKSETFAEADLVCMYPLGHPFGELERITFQDLIDEPLIAFPPSNPHRKWLDTKLEECGATPYIRVETPMSETVASMVGRGLGVAVINPFTVASFLDIYSVGIRPLEESISMKLLLWRPEHRPTSSINETFLDHLKESRDHGKLKIAEALKKS